MAFPRRPVGTAPALIATTLFLAGAPAFADAGASDDWNRWTLTPDLLIPTALVAAIYVAGMVRRHAATDAGRAWRHVAFLSGLAAVFLSLASPIDGLSDHLFWMHQIQHMLLRMIGPMLVMLAAPQATLIAGLPATARRGMLPPIVTNGAIRGLFAILTDPVVVTVLFIAALFVWQYPPFHNAAILNEGIHYTMHVTMLVAGLFFWWRVFDPRPDPAGLTYGKRLMMLWVVTLSNIGLGAYTTLKSALLYPAYDVDGRLFGIAPLTDERIGGFIIWVPSSMMCLLAILVVIHRWGRTEAKQAADANRRALAPTTGAELAAGARSKNQALAIGISAFVLSMFVAAIAVAVLAHLNDTASSGLLAHAVP